MHTNLSCKKIKREREKKKHTGKKNYHGNVDTPHRILFRCSSQEELDGQSKWNIWDSKTYAFRTFVGQPAAKKGTWKTNRYYHNVPYRNKIEGNGLIWPKRGTSNEPSGTIKCRIFIG